MLTYYKSMKKSVQYLIVFGLLSFATVITLLATGVIHVKKHHTPQNKQKEKEIHISKNDNYIDPTPCKVGLMNKPKVYKSANLCNDKVLYPIQGLDVDYNLPKIPDNCPCTQFIKPP